jgi:hypothetical protein
LRYRKGSLLERQQIKWLALFGVVLITWTLLGLVVFPLLTGGELMHRQNNLASMLFFIFAELFPPVAIGVAVLRYHLWDIDLIIRRTLVYSILTVSLTPVYFGSVLWLEEVARLITGQRDSPIAIVLSTLAIAALFTPFRQGIQDRVDHRFYRQKYNAEKVLGVFNASLRNEVDLNHLTDSIQEVVNETLQPAHTSMWLCSVNLQPKEPLNNIGSFDGNKFFS